MSYHVGICWKSKKSNAMGLVWSIDTHPPHVGYRAEFGNRNRSICRLRIAIMALSRTVSEINGDSVQNRKFSHPRVFCASAEGVPLRTGYRRSVPKKLEWWDNRAEKEVCRSSAVWIQYTNVTDRRRDGRTDTGRQQRPHTHSVAR